MSISNVSSGASALDQYQLDSDRFATGNELGKDQFLQLLVAQMNNQDPLSPQENGEFIAQLAQFSTVEGIDNLNGSMESLLSGYQSSQALQASSMVGRTVIVPTDQAVVDTSAGLEAGMHDFTWDGTDGAGNLMEPGVYTFEAMATINGTNTQMATLLPANVDSVSLGAGSGGEMLLNVAGLGSISLSNVYAIQ